MFKIPTIQEPKVQQAMDFFQRNGWTPEQAAGIVANLHYESKGLNENQLGDGNAAYGLGQWHPDRQQQFQDWSGKSIKDSSFTDQLGFVQHELTNGQDAGARKAGRLLPDAQDPCNSAVIFMQNFERPKDNNSNGVNAFTRGYMAQGLYNSLSPSGENWTAPQPQQVQPRMAAPSLSPSVYAVPRVST